jgi:hypothetical protein
MELLVETLFKQAASNGNFSIILGARSNLSRDTGCTDVFRGSPQSVRLSAWIVPDNQAESFLSYPSQFIVPIIRCSIVWLLTASLNKPSTSTNTSF